MHKEIWKFPWNSEYNIMTLKDICVDKFLTVQLQHGVPTIWAIVDKKAPSKTYQVYFVGTGWTLSDSVGNYIGTIQQDGFVWHYFWREVVE